MTAPTALQEWVASLSLARLEELAVLIAATIAARECAAELGRIASCEILEDGAVLSLVVVPELGGGPDG